MTLQEYISFWQETYDKHQSRPTTYAAHNYVFKNHILPGLGDVFLNPKTGAPYKLYEFYYLHKKILKQARLPWVAFRDLQCQCMEVGI